MSKIGKLPIKIPQGVTVVTQDHTVQVTGPLGTLNFQTRPEVKVQVTSDEVKVSRGSDTKVGKSLHGLTRTIIANMIIGVDQKHQKVLEIIGVGYRAAKEGDNLHLFVGYSHPVVFEKINGIDFETRENKIFISGADKALVGETAARIRRVKPPEPYKGKGIKYLDEVIRRKAGKTVKTGPGAP